MELNILGTIYTLSVETKEQNKFLETCDGYCDKTSKRIVVKGKEDNCDLDFPEAYINKVKRHEIIHAFLFESGLGECFQHKEWGHEETTVDWIAIQFPKLLKAFMEADCL